MADAALVLTLAESDYLYGTGPLTIRVHRVNRERPFSYAGETWYRVYGVELGFTDRELGERTVLVRAGRLP